MIHYLRVTPNNVFLFKIVLTMWENWKQNDTHCLASQKFPILSDWLVNTLFSLYICQSDGLGIINTSVYHQPEHVDAPALHSVCRTEIKAVYSAQHKHVGINTVMSAAGFRLAPRQEHLSSPAAQITKSPVDQCVLISNECAVNTINVIRLIVYLLIFPAISPHLL